MLIWSSQLSILAYNEAGLEEWKTSDKISSTIILCIRQKLNIGNSPDLTEKQLWEKYNDAKKIWKRVFQQDLEDFRKSTWKI